MSSGPKADMALPAVDPAQRLLDLIAKAEPRLRRALLNAIAAARNLTTLEVLAELIELGRFQEAIDAAAQAAILSLAGETSAIYILAGQEGAEFLSDVLEVAVDFDQVNARAVSIMQQERFRMIEEFTAAQRQATRAALVDGIQRGLNPIEQARNFRASIGLTAKQQVAVENYRKLLTQGSSEALSRDLRDRRFDATVRRAIRNGEPLTATQINRMVSRYNDRFIIFRSNTIARTEALRTVHQGTEEAYEQAFEQGALDRDQVERTWNAAGDDRVRDTHDDYDGEVRAVGEKWGPLRFPGDSQAPPRETVQCRCALSTRIDILKQ